VAATVVALVTAGAPEVPPNRRNRRWKMCRASGCPGVHFEVGPASAALGVGGAVADGEEFDFDHVVVHQVAVEADVDEIGARDGRVGAGAGGGVAGGGGDGKAARSGRIQFEGERARGLEGRIAANDTAVDLFANERGRGEIGGGLSVEVGSDEKRGKECGAPEEPAAEQRGAGGDHERVWKLEENTPVALIRIYAVTRKGCEARGAGGEFRKGKPEEGRETREGREKRREIGKPGNPESFSRVTAARLQERGVTRVAKAASGGDFEPKR